MSYPKKNVQSHKAVVSPTKDDPKREKLQAILEREQLKGLLVNKFAEKYGKSKQKDQDYVNQQVNEFMKNEKVTEDNLRKLEQRIKDGVQNQGSNQKNAVSSPTYHAQPSSVSYKQENNQYSNQGAQHYHDHDDAVSVASSQKPRSVYAQDDNDDEWATIMKYDTDLYRKEKELDKARQVDQKKKIKDELDRQVEEKRRAKERDEEETRKYTQLVGGQLDQFDTKEKKKENEMKNKIMNQKELRDKQLQDEQTRKKLAAKNEKQMDELLVKKIQEELNEESRAAAAKRQNEKEQLRRVLSDNEANKIKVAEQNKREKQSDVQAQQEYTRLIEKQEADRAAELQAREDRSKRFMNMMADTVVKDQKAQIVAEERKLLQHVGEKEGREADEDRRRQQRLADQRRDMRDYLDQQMAEKERKKQEEKVLEKKQAEIWKKDTEDFNNHEKSKAEYIKNVNYGHADHLKKQMEEERKRQKKITTQELLMNKPILKQIATQADDANFHKELVNPRY